MPTTEPPPAPLAAAPVKHRPRRISRPQAQRVFGALVFATVACVGIVEGRRFYPGAGPQLHYLVWDLVLAWIPLGFSFAAYRSYASRTRRNVLFIICAAAWFLFFPNAPYITTDVVHIHNDRMAVSWFQFISIMSYAWTGLCLGYLSLYLMQEVVRARCGRIVSWVFVAVMLGAGSMGIYMGRFLRWNSWDLLRHPLGHLRFIYHQAVPFEESGRSTFVELMFVFLVLSYGILYSLTHLHEPARAEEPADG